MYKTIFMLVALQFFFGCTAFENTADDRLYNSFEDDFFGDSGSDLSLSMNAQNNNRNNDKNLSKNEFDKLDPEYINENGRDSVVSKINGMSSSSNNFVGDNYMFSFTVGEGDSLKDRMKELLEPYGYKLIWKSNYEIYFENDVLYEDKLLVNVLKNISSDLLNMGIDIHINVYLKNKVVLVYSVRS